MVEKAARITIRSAVASDGEAIQRVFTSSILAQAGAGYSRQQLLSWSQIGVGFGVGDGFFWVLDADGEIVGFVSVSLDAGSVTHLYVLPLEAGKGFGSTLLEHAERTLRQSGIRTLSLASALHAVKFYEFRGWIQILELERTVGEVQIPMIHMEKRV